MKHTRRGYNKFFIKGFEEKGILPVYLSDATQGVNIRNNLPDPNVVKQLERSTAFPSPILLASTFSPELSYQYAKAIGEECRAGGIEVLLGPGLNIYRQSLFGISNGQSICDRTSKYGYSGMFKAFLRE